jgi:hypothetical protein
MIHMVQIKINFDRDTGIEDIRNVSFWDSYYGFSLYLPFSSMKIIMVVMCMVTIEVIKDN